MTVREMLSRIDSRELTEWQAYAELEPFGEWRGDLRAGIVASTIANVNRKKDSKPFKASDFMPEFGKQKDAPVKKQSVSEMKEILLNIAKVQNSKERRK